METAEATATDSDLVAAVLAGRRSAFAGLARRHEPAVLAVALGILQDRHAAQDVAQDALLTAYRKLSSLRDPAAFGPWALRIAHRAARRMARSIRRRAGRAVPIDAAGDLPAPDGGPALFDDGEQILLAAVMRLPRSERMVVLLRHFDGHSLPEIARILGRPIGSVTKQLSRAHLRLRDQLEDLRP